MKLENTHFHNLKGSVATITVIYIQITPSFYIQTQDVFNGLFIILDSNFTVQLAYINQNNFILQ